MCSATYGGRFSSPLLKMKNTILSILKCCGYSRKRKNIFHITPYIRSLKKFHIVQLYYSNILVYSKLAIHH